MTDLCPYHAVYWNEEKNVAQKCTMCAHIMDGGQEPCKPRCAHSCPTESIQYYELEPGTYTLEVEGNVVKTVELTESQNVGSIFID